MKNFFDDWQDYKLDKTSVVKEPFSWCKFEDEHPFASALIMMLGQAIFVACAATIAVACFYL